MAGGMWLAGTIDYGYTGLVYDSNYGWWYVENGNINLVTQVCTMTRTVAGGM